MVISLLSALKRTVSDLSFLANSRAQIIMQNCKGAGKMLKILCKTHMIVLCRYQVLCRNASDWLCK